jgi:hypothetical protein
MYTHIDKNYAVYVCTQIFIYVYTCIYICILGNKHTVGSLTVGNNMSDQSNGRRRGNLPSQLELQIQYSELKYSHSQLASEYTEEEVYMWIHVYTYVYIYVS